MQHLFITHGHDEKITGMCWNIINIWRVALDYFE